MVMSASNLWNDDWIFPSSPLHPLLIIVVGSIVIVGTGWLLSKLSPRAD
jgi:hypothetical protein